MTRYFNLKVTLVPALVLLAIPIFIIIPLYQHQELFGRSNSTEPSDILLDLLRSNVNGSALRCRLE